MATFTDLPIDLQEKIMKTKADLEEEDRLKAEIDQVNRRRREMDRDYHDAMYEFITDCGYWEAFLEDFMDKVDEEEEEEWKEFFGLNEEEEA